MKTVLFRIPGEPKGKQRPRVVSRNGFSRAYTPKETVAYENLIKVEYELQADRFRFDDGAMLSMTISAFYAIPKSTSKKKRAQMLSGEIRPIKKPDADNILKCVADSLNQIAYKDDTQLVDCRCMKFYSDEPRLEVRIAEILD